MKIWNTLYGHSWNESLYSAGKDYLKDGRIPTHFTESQRKSFMKRMSYYTLKNGKIVHTSSFPPPWMENVINYSNTNEYTVVKPSEKHNVLRQYFSIESRMAFNYKTLYDFMRREYHLGITRNDVLEYIKNNPVNLKEITVPNNKPYQQSYRPMFPFEHWQIDLIDFRRISKYNKFDGNDLSRSYNFILVVIDIFSKFIYLFPLEGTYKGTEINSSGNPGTFTRTLTSEICNHLQNLFLAGDLPQKIGCDNGFNNGQFVKFCNDYNVRPIFSLPHHPQTNGFVENKNKQIKAFIYHHFNKHQSSQFKYHDILPFIAYAINNTQHSVTKKTPNEIHRGRVLPLPATYQPVRNLPDTFDKAFPVLENSSNPINNMNSFKKSNVTPVNNDGTQDDNELIKQYDTMAQEVYSKRVEIIRDKLHYEAQKREAKYKSKESVNRFSTNSVIKVRTYLDTGKEWQPIQLVLRNKSQTDREVKLQNPVFPKVTIKKQKKTSNPDAKAKMNWKNLPENIKPYFRISEIVQKEGISKKYRLTTLNNEYNLFFITDMQHGKIKYSDEFIEQMLHHAAYGDLDMEKTYRPQYTQAPIMKPVEINLNQNESANMNENTNDELKFMKGQYDYKINTNVRQLNNKEYQSIWKHKDVADELKGQKIIIKYKKNNNDENFIRVIGEIGDSYKISKQSNKNKDGMTTRQKSKGKTLFDILIFDYQTESQFIDKLRNQDIEDDFVYVIEKKKFEINTEEVEFLFRFPYHIRKIFNIS